MGSQVDQSSPDVEYSMVTTKWGYSQPREYTKRLLKAEANGFKASEEYPEHALKEQEPDLGWNAEKLCVVAWAITFVCWWDGEETGEFVEAEGDV